MNDGYFRHPTVHGDRVVFVSEDDLWEVPLTGGTARRLTAGRGDASRPSFSPDGSKLAFTSREEQHAEVYCMDSLGGPATRLTFLGNALTRGWTGDGHILFASDHAQPFLGRITELYGVDPQGGWHDKLPLGPALEASWATESSGVVIGRHTIDPARWKRYRGGTAGQLWVDATGDGQFERILAKLEGNLGSPMWIGSRVYFVSDHEGIGNIYSCQPDGTDVQRHTHHDDFYARYPSTDGTTIVYHAGAQLYRLDVASSDGSRIDVDLRSTRTQRNRKFVATDRFLFDFAVHPEGHSIAVESRGKAFSMPLWEQAPRQWGKADGVRYRHGQWLHDGSTFLCCSDENGDETLEVYTADALEPAQRLDLDLGRVEWMRPSPTEAKVVIANHRCELLLVDVDAKTKTVLDRSDYWRVSEPAWSPDGRWVAYGYSPSPRTMNIRVVEIATGDVHDVTRPDFNDFGPSWDPEGKYLYFLSYRHFDPVYDSHFFDLGFPRGVKAMLVTLAADTPSPFQLEPKGFGEAGSKKEDAANDDGDDAKTSGDGDSDAAGDDAPTPITLDLEGIDQRVLAFPIPEGKYSQVRGIKGKALFTAFDARGSLNRSWGTLTPDANGRIESFDLSDLKHETIIPGVSYFEVAADHATLVYRAGNRLRALKAGDKPDDGDGPGRKTGWIDLSRIRISVNPVAEWHQMLEEAWRLQRDHFWTADLSGVDWPGVLERYRPLVEKVTTRLEFSDLMWEMQGELGTSHAYELGGDHRPAPAYPLGLLGADLEFDANSGLYRVTRLVRGDSWDPDRSSPLAAPGLGVTVGSTILAVAGQQVSRERSPLELLVNQADTTVELVVGDDKGKDPRTIWVRTLSDEHPARYREWVERNRQLVHERTNGAVGYVHVPDMGPTGYSEFHRYLSSELNYSGLIVDVRFNGGGHVSQLILEKLARKRIGYCVSRWGAPEPYPSDTCLGPIVAVTNEKAGSDGDIFSHCFKLLEIGPLVGTRTWGGVIGINSRHALADGSLTTQPEYAFWFEDAKWGVENYGTDPDHEVDIAPQDWVAGRDPQLEKAFELVQAEMAKSDPREPDFSERPVVLKAQLASR